MSKTFVIAGAGFQGFCDAVELLKKPDHKVYIIEPAPFFGGILNSFQLNGFAVDKGVHFFDSIPHNLADIINDIMDGQTRTIDFVSASAFNGKVTEGFSLPDLNSLNDRDLKEKIKLEVLEKAEKNTPLRETLNLHRLFEERYGPTAGQIYADIFNKIYGINATEASPNTLQQTSLGRLKFLDDPEMLELKAKCGRLEEVLAARRKSMNLHEDTVSLYPSTGEAMGGWCTRAKKWLEKKGATICLGEKIVKIEDQTQGVKVTTNRQFIDVDHVIWSNDNVNALGQALGFNASYMNDFQHGTPLIFVVMTTLAEKIKDFTYLQNFDLDGVAYRTASSGLVSQQINEGVSYITSECPAVVGSERWNNASDIVESVWNECKALGILEVDAEMYDCKVVPVPVTYKLNKVGFPEKLKEFESDVAKRSLRVLFRNTEPFFRKDIYLDSLNLTNLVGA